MKILVLGATGMLGHKVVQHFLARKADLWWTFRGPLNDRALDPLAALRGARAIPCVDAMTPEAIRTVLDRVRPDVVINCIGVVKQRQECADPVVALTLNSILPHEIARTVAAWNGRLVHISTDCVFSGRRGGYSEADEPDPVDLYGRTKLLGEPEQPNAVTLRTSLIGRELRTHASLLDWFLSHRGQRINGFRRAIWSGVTTPFMSRVIADVVYEHRSLSGVYHVAGERVSKFELLCRLNDAFRADAVIDGEDVFTCDRSLVGDRFVAATHYRIPPLSELIQELATDPTPYPQLGRPT